MSDALIEIQGLKTHFFTDKGIVKAVDGVDLVIRPGQTWVWSANRVAANP
jgi:ABC-type dipeptide/oligopeptide/nickel transport system ATPase component